MVVKKTDCELGSTWSLQKGFHKNAQFEAFRPKFKKTQKKVIFLTKKEIKKLENYKIPETKLYLYRVRDVFLFCCYTGLRYSDVYNLKKYDVKSDHIVWKSMHSSHFPTTRRCL